MKKDQYVKFKQLKDQYDAKRRAIIRHQDTQSKEFKKLLRDYLIFERWVKKQPGYTPSYSPRNREKYLQIPRSLVETKRLTAADKLVYGYLYTLGQFMPFITVACQTISKRVGISLRTVHRSLINLETKGYLTIVRYSRGEQLYQGRENVYVCEEPIPDDAEKSIDRVLKWYEAQDGNIWIDDASKDKK